MSSDPDRVLGDAASAPLLPGTNLPVPDQLAAVRQEMKRLEEQEAELRRLLITKPEIRTGAAWRAEIKEVVQQRTDLKEMRACYPEIVDEFTFPVTATHVVLSGLTEDGEIVSARKMRALNK